jgi:conjugative relaxase-like TrwC/TraI family protein
VTTMTTIHAGHDIAYLTRGHEDGGCAGAMAYYTASGEPPGVWAGKGAAKLGLSGEVDPKVIERLYMKRISPDGEILGGRRQSKTAKEREDVAVARYARDHPYASATEVAEVRVAERGRDPKQRPYFDLTTDLVKSVSVLHASYRVSAARAREEDDEALAAALDAKAGEIEQALIEVAHEAVEWAEENATYTRTGHHSSTSGEYRDGDGLAAAIFLHHISRDGDPHLHVHIAVFNGVQRADGADEEWRTLDSRVLHAQRLGLAATVDRLLEVKLTRLGHVMVPRADGNGAEVGGVSQDVMDEFSSRSRALTPKLKSLIDQYVAIYGKQPSKRTIWLLGQQAAQNTRRSKAEAKRTVAGRTGSSEPGDAERFAAWESQTTERELQALSQVHQAEAAYAAARTGRPRTVLDDAAKCKAARIAVAEVQTHHAVWSMAQLRFEVHRALPVMNPDDDADAVITEVAELAVGGRAGTGVVRVDAPDVTDVTSLGVRTSDGGSIYRPPQEATYTTLDHLDTEEQILTTARQQVPQLVTQQQARTAVAATDLNGEQAEAVVAMLTATTRTTGLIAPAGAGKSHTMAVFARLWEQLTGGRVIGLTTSTNAARVLQGEGLTAAYNIAQFLGKIEGSDELRHPVTVRADDVLVIDEATQVSTADMAMIQEATRRAGARDTAVGDTAQLGAVDAGGIFRLLATEVPVAELHEVRRFRAAWEADASVRLRAGDTSVIEVYDRHGRIRHGDEETIREMAAAAWAADHLSGKDVLLLAATNEDAADLARRVQARLIQAGKVGTRTPYWGEVTLADGNQAHPGDLIRARLNTKIDAGGQSLANRDTLKITTVTSGEVQVRRQRLDGTWTGPFWIPRTYLAASAELAYAGNVHVAEGRTADIGYLLVTDTLTRQSGYVGMGRGRELNVAFVVTGKTAPAGHKPYEQATPESVLKNILETDDADLSATEAIRQSQEWASGTGHLANLWTHAVAPALHADIDQRIEATLTEAQAARYRQEPERRVLHAELRAAHLAGHDITQAIGQITAAPLDGLRSISAGLHGRLKSLGLTDQGRHTPWTHRTPATAPPVARELAEALDHRHRELGERAAADPPPWLTRYLRLEPGASPALQADYLYRAGTAAAYRENAGITDPNVAVAPGPHHGNPELEHQRQEAIRALEIRDEAAMWAGMNRGQLEACQAAAQRAMATEPPDVSAQLRLTAHAEADTRREAAEATAAGDTAAARAAVNLADILTAKRQDLETADTAYQRWATQTRTQRELGDKATAELTQRGHHGPGHQPGTGPQDQPGTEATEAEQYRQLTADLAALDRALGIQQKAALDQGQPWPPRPQAETTSGVGNFPTSEHTEAGQFRQLADDLAAVGRALDREQQAAPARETEAEAKTLVNGTRSGGTGHQLDNEMSELGTGLDGAGRALDRERQDALDNGQPWPPRPQTEAEVSDLDTSATTEPGQFVILADDLAAVGRGLSQEHQAAIEAGHSWPPEPRPAADTAPGTAAARELSTGLRGLSADLDALDQAFDRHADTIRAAVEARTAEQAALRASSAYITRIRQEAQTQPEARPEQAARLPDEMEIG